MVQSKIRKRLYFILFVLPAFALYALFFIYPFINGVLISFTNWDGLTPRSPISMPKDEFESSILSKLKGKSDRNFLLSIYTLEEGDDYYRREALRGLNRSKIDLLMGKVGYEPKRYKNVGLGNYVDIFTGKLEKDFYPRFYSKLNYSKTSSLPTEIPKRSYERDFISKLSAEDLVLARTFYVLRDDEYVLEQEKSELAFRNRLYNLPEVISAKTLKLESIDGLVSGLRTAGLAEDQPAKEAALARFFSTEKLSVTSRTLVSETSELIFNLGVFRNLLAETWVQAKFDMGVAGFTAFFAIMTVIFGNLVAFALAMALDSKIKSKNVLRSVFFLPNVLSMVVVALIWSFVFFHFLPKLTGINTWMGDPNKTPWLIVLVAIWQAAGYYMVIYLAGLQNIPTDVMEAATIDGASWWQRLRHITLPMLAPAFTICFFLSIANALKSFDLMYAMVGPSGYALGTVPLVMDIFFDAYAKKAAGLAAAKAFVLFALIFLVTGIQIKYMSKKEVQL